jgi:cytosine deaminase
VPACLVDGVALAGDGDGLARVDIDIADGRIAAIRPAAPNADRTERGSPTDLGGGMVWPCFVDCHTHLDKGHIWARKPNPDGTFDGALTSVGDDRAARWSREDVDRRMEFGLRTAYAHGTGAIRTHLDSIAPQEEISWPVFEEMRETWAGRIELQAASLVGIESVREADWFERLADRVADAGGVLGAVAYMVPDIDELLDRVFRAAMKRGLDLDFHTDETADPEARGLRHIAEAALRHGFEGRILAGHCCSLARQPDAEVLGTLDLVAEAGIAAVSLPLCNLYLQDRRTGATTPRWRGVTLLHEMKARGIKVAVASDNTRDPFYAYGDLDGLEVYRQATRICHFDHPVGDWPNAMARTPAEIMGLEDCGTLAVGGPADMVLFRGRSWTEVLSRPESERVVIRNGTAIIRQIPDYAELDDLMGAG